MPIVRNKFLYDLTVRFGPSGFKGAHAIDLEQVSDGEEVISEKEMPARPITEAEFSTLLTGQTAALIEAADQARRDRDIQIGQAVEKQRAAEKDFEIAKGQLAVKEQDLNETRAALKDAKAKIEKLKKVDDAQQ